MRPPNHYIYLQVLTRNLWSFEMIRDKRDNRLFRHFDFYPYNYKNKFINKIIVSEKIIQFTYSLHTVQLMRPSSAASGGRLRIKHFTAQE